MSFRAGSRSSRRVAVAVAVVLASVLAYVVVATSCAARSTTRSARRASRARPASAAAARHRAARRAALPRIPGPAARRGEPARPGRRAPTDDDPRPTAAASAARRRRARDVAAGERGGVLSDARVGGDARCACSPRPAATRLAVQLARPLDRGRPHARALRRILVAGRAWRDRARGALGLVVARAALAPVAAAHRGDRARRRDRGTCRAASTSRGDDELGRLAASFNTMLAALERVRARAAPTRRRRLARAAHAAHEPADEHRGAARDETLPRGERERLLARRDRADRGADRPHHRPGRARARDEPDAPSAEDVRLDRSSRGGRARAAAPARRDLRDRRSSRALVRGVPDRLDRAIANLLDNAASGARPAARSRSRSADGEVTRARPRPRDRRRRPAARLRPLLPRAARRAACPARGSASRSSGRSPRRTAAASPSSRPRAAARSCGSGLRQIRNHLRSL